MTQPSVSWLFMFTARAAASNLLAETLKKGRLQLLQPPFFMGVIFVAFIDNKNRNDLIKTLIEIDLFVTMVSLKFYLAISSK